MDTNPLAEIPGHHGELSPEADAAWSEIEEADCQHRKDLEEDAERDRDFAAYESACELGVYHGPAPKRYR
jgi:hypothetical protein